MSAVTTSASNLAYKVSSSVAASATQSLASSRSSSISTDVTSPTEAGPVDFSKMAPPSDSFLKWCREQLRPLSGHLDSKSFEFKSVPCVLTIDHSFDPSLSFTSCLRR